MRKLLPLVLLLLATCSSPSEPSRVSDPARAAATAARPDIVVVISDDQRFDQMSYMPLTTALLEAEAVQFDEAYTTTPQCCPSRSTFFTGLYSHNTGVLTSGSPNGGAIKFKPSSTIATWLKGAGYRTILVGKYLNGFKAQKVGPAVPPGWTQFVANWCSDDDAYYCQLDSNGVVKTPAAGTYSVTQTASIATNYINSAPATTPLFLMWTPFGPHSALQNGHVSAPKPEFPADLAPFLGDPPFRPLAFDSLPTPSPAWIGGIGPFSQAVRDSIDDFRRNAQAALQSVDRGVAKLIAALKAKGRWQNTIFIFWSDNGLSYGEHRIADNKFCPYEDCQRVPMWIRLPGGIGRHDSTIVANLDLAPTLAAFAGVTPASAVDGLSLVPLLQGGGLPRSCLLLEQLGTGLAASTFQAIRCNRWKYVEYANGDAELYDLNVDRAELDNHAADPAYAGTVSTLAAQLAQYKPVAVLIAAGTGTGGGTVSGPFGISCTISNGTTSGSCGYPLITGSILTFTAAPSSYGTFLGWGGACSGAAPACTVTFNGAQTVTAAFAPPPNVALILQAGPTMGDGTVTGPNGFNCSISGGKTSGLCTLQLPQGSSAVLTAAPTGGAGFSGWGGACSGTTTNCTVTLTASQTITAGFNNPPVALFADTCLHLACTFDGSASSDDAAVATWSWSFGDGNTATGASAQHSYAAAGDYTVTLSVLDAEGLTSSQARSISVSVPVNQPPVAGLTDSCTYLVCTVDGAPSTDDTAVVAWDWDFGDGGTATGLTAVHDYATAGSFTVSLTVTDGMGLTGSTTRTLTVAPRINQAPVASFTDRCTLLDCSFDAAGSSDDLGIASYDWTFGDGTAATGTSVSHAYAADGDYVVTLTTTDGEGLASTTTKTTTVSATPPPNQPPVAAMSESCTRLDCAFTGAGSTDDIGIVSYDWSFGDGAGATGVTTSHAYAIGGSYSVSLTVTDGGGLAHSDYRTITVAQPPTATFTATCTQLACSFDGSGSSDDIGVVSYDWAFGDGTTAAGMTTTHDYAIGGSYIVTLTVTDGSGLVSSRSMGVTVNLPPVASFTENCSLLACGFDGAPSTDDIGIVSYAWDLGDGSAGSGIAPSHSYLSGGSYTVTLTVTDGGGLSSTQSHLVTVTAPVNQPPVASFTSGCTLLACGFNASGSTDDNGIVSYAWDFGDGSAGTGVSPSHGYASGGSYTVTLTVTDGGGLSSTQSSVVTVAAPVNQPPVASFTSSCAQLTCGFNASGSTDDNGIVSYAWSFGDGGNATGVAPTHSYATSGTFTVTLTVTDAGGLTSSQTTSVTVTAANKAPVARFSYSCNAAHSCTLDGGSSTDDVAVVLYTWTFGATGAGGTATGVTTIRPYSKAGSYVVNLIVTDGGGLSNKISKTIVVP